MKLPALAAVFASAALAGCAVTDPGPPGGPVDAGVLEWRDLRRLPQPAPVPPLSYGTEPHQTGELRLPPGVPGPFPVLVLVRGLCWEAAVGHDYLRPLADALATLGVATWTVDYRSPENGGGWPGTFLDVARATDHLRVLAQTYPLDLGRIVVAGHASGGQLALWLATRRRLKQGDALFIRDPLAVRGVIGLAAITDLDAQRDAGDAGCGDAVDALLAGAPDDALKRVSPASLLPLGVPQWFVHGALDTRVPEAEIMAYVERARRRGDAVTVGITSAAGHYEPAAPGSATWMTLQQAVIDSLLE